MPCGAWWADVSWRRGVTALVIAAVLTVHRRFTVPGHRARLMGILYCSAQLLLESLRRDNFLRWLFVRVSQLTAYRLTLRYASE